MYLTCARSCLGALSPCQTLANSIRSSVCWPSSFERRYCTNTVHFPTTWTRPPVRSQARAWCGSLFARCPHATRPQEALLRQSALHASERGSPKVPSSHRFSHTVRLGRRKASVASGRRWPTRLPFDSLCVVPCLGELPPFEPLTNSIRNSVSWPFSFERRNSTETVPDVLHETSRAIQSSRLVPITFGTMSI